MRRCGRGPQPDRSRLDPFHIGAEPALPGKINGGVNAKTCRIGHRIDETREGLGPAYGEIVSLRIPLLRTKLGRETLEVMKELRRPVACGIDDDLSVKHGRGSLARVHQDAALTSCETFHLGAQNKLATCRFDVCEQRQTCRSDCR